MINHPESTQIGDTPAESCRICDEDAAFLRGARPSYETSGRVVRMVDLFSGCGGLSLGIAEAARRQNLGIDVRLAIDADEDAVAVYRANFPQADVRQGLVESCFDGEIGTNPTPNERQLTASLGEIDVLVGGPPCQGYSNLNNHTRRDDPRNALYARMARAAEILRPAMVLVENVPMVKHDVEKVLDATMGALRSAGYAVDEDVLDLAALGAPQRRRRHVILASLGTTFDPSQVLRSVGTRCARHPTRSLRWAIEDLLDASDEDPLDVASKPKEENVKRIDHLFDNNLYDLPNDLRPPCQRSEHSYPSMYGRLKWDEPAQTVTTGFGCMGQGRYVHPARRRTITPHEAARLQMLPDFWSLGAARTRGALARLIGNAVPPVLSIAIGECTLPAVVRAPTRVVVA